jgi:hypothetical protein
MPAAVMAAFTQFVTGMPASGNKKRVLHALGQTAGGAVAVAAPKLETLDSVSTAIDNADKDIIAKEKQLMVAKDAAAEADETWKLKMKELKKTLYAELVQPAESKVEALEAALAEAHKLHQELTSKKRVLMGGAPEASGPAARAGKRKSTGATSTSLKVAKLAPAGGASEGGASESGKAGEDFLGKLAMEEEVARPSIFVQMLGGGFLDGRVLFNLKSLGLVGDDNVPKEGANAKVSQFEHSVETAEKPADAEAVKTHLNKNYLAELIRLGLLVEDDEADDEEDEEEDEEEEESDYEGK